MQSLFDIIDAVPEESGWRPTVPPSLAGVSELALDTETTGLDWRRGDRPIGLSGCLPDGSTFYLPWGHVGGNLSEDAVREWARNELRGKRLNFLNAPFDVHQFRVWGVDLEAMGCSVHDVGHSAALLDDLRIKFNLEDLGQAYLGTGKLEGLDKTRMRAYHASKVDGYARQDARLVRDLALKMQPLLVAEELERVSKLEDDLIFPVCEMEKNLIHLDMELLAQFERESRVEYEGLVMDFYRETGLRFNPSASAHWEQLFKKCGIPPPRDAGTDPKKKKKAGITFADEQVQGFQHPWVQKARYLRKLKNLRVKFFVAYQNAVLPDGRLPFHLHQLRSDEGGTVSGRFSATNENIQQVAAVKKQIKKMGHDRYLVRALYVPPKGEWLAAEDAKQIEYRLFAHYSGAPKVLAAYAADPETDFHDFVMSMVQRVRPDITRERTKDTNFAKIYGAGRGKIALMLNLPRTESDRFVTAYDKEFPEAETTLKKAAKIAAERGYVRTYIGRRMRFKDKKRLHKALNGVIQGTAADVMKQKIVELHRERKYTNYTMRLTVHDESVGSIPDPECLKRVSEVLGVQSFPFKVPILWDAKVGRNWKECK